ncbi:MAG: LysR substrate-binding domain-containing protein [Alphaproteobacteria bacterium]
MTLRELQYLVAVADLGHFGRAAEACHVSQPTLSAQLRKLEETLGFALVERTSRAVHVTPLGAQVVARARRMLAEAEAIRGLARRAAAPLSQPLTLGVIPTLGPYLLPWLTAAVAAAYPDLRLVVHEDQTDRLLRALADYRIDVGLMALPVAAPAGGGDGLATLPLFDEPFLVAAPPGHPFARLRRVEPERLAAERLLLLTDGHCLRDQALAVCRLAAEPQASADFRAAGLETLRQMVAAGMGCTLLPAMAADAAGPSSVVVRPLAGDAGRRIGMVWRNGYDRAGDLHLLAALIRASAPPTVTPVAA